MTTEFTYEIEPLHTNIGTLRRGTIELSYLCIHTWKEENSEFTLRFTVDFKSTDYYKFPNDMPFKGYAALENNVWVFKQIEARLGEGGTAAWTMDMHHKGSNTMDVIRGYLNDAFKATWNQEVMKEAAKACLNRMQEQAFSEFKSACKVYDMWRNRIADIDTLIEQGWNNG